MVISMNTSGGTIAINPDEVSQAVPMSGGGVKITMKNRIEHFAVGELADVMGRINIACATREAD